MEEGAQVARNDEGFAPVEGGRLFYEVRGAGDPVLFIHAGLWDARIWDRQVAALADRHTVVRFDLRGFGRSDRLSGPFSFRQDVADLIGFLGLGPVVLVGASIGGSLAIDTALEYPTLVRGLVLAAPGLSGDDTPDDEATTRLVEEAEAALAAGDLDRAVDLQLRIWTPPGGDPEVDRRIWEIAIDNRHVDTQDWGLSRRLDPPAVGRLSEIGVPTLVILGDRDAPMMRPIAERIVADIPGARLEVVPGADHLPNMREPGRFNELLSEFLDRLEG